MLLKASATVFVFMLLTSAVAASASETLKTPDPTIRDLFRAENLVIPSREEELGRDVYQRTWDFAAADKGNFTEFSAEIRDLTVTPQGSLSFRMDKGRAASAWGNGSGK